MPNPCAPSTASTVAPPCLTTSTLLGIGNGVSESAQAVTEVFQETKTGERDSLLEAIKILLKDRELHEQALLGMDLAPKELQDMLKLVREIAAESAKNSSIAPLTAGSHISNLPIDTANGIQGVSKFISKGDKLSHTQQASTLNVDKELEQHKSNFSANCQALCENFEDIFDEVSENYAKEYKGEGSSAQSHVLIPASTGLGALATGSLVSLMVDLVGSSLREISGLIEFSRQECTHPKEKNIYLAFSECCKSFCVNKNSKESFQALRKLEEAILDFNAARDMLKNHGVTAPSLSVFMRLITAEPFVKTLVLVNASSLGLTEAAHAVGKEKHKLSQNTGESAPKASLIKDFSGGDAHSHSQNVSVFCEQVDDTINHIDEQLPAQDRKGLVATSAKSTVRSTGVFLSVASLIPGFIGLISREFSASLDFTKNDKGAKQECTKVALTNKELTGDDLDKLMTRVCELKERLERCNELGVSAPLILGSGETISFGSTIASLNMIAGMFSALRELRTLAQSPSNATKLDKREKKQAKVYAKSVINSNKEVAKSSGIESVSGNLSLHQQLQSVMEKVVLSNRSYEPQNFGANRHDLNSMGKSTIGFSQGNSTGFLLGSLGILALTALQSGIGLEALFRSSFLSSQSKRASEGVDRIESGNGFKSNLSFFCNATRLSEDKQNSSISQTASKTTHLGLESTFSRSLTVALCHSGALTEILRRLVQEEKEQIEPVEGQSKSALVSDAVMPKLYDKILRVLDDAQLNHNPIPNLNRHMASSGASVSNTVIASALASHQVFISPVLKSFSAAKKASNIGDDQKFEAIANSSATRIANTVSNVIQAFTINFQDEIGRQLNNPMKNSSLLNSSNNSSAFGMIASCAVSLLCEELFELCMSRSLTLLDKQKMAKSHENTSNICKNETKYCADAIKDDSGLGQESSVSHIISAMRLTLSHLGEALHGTASEMNACPDVLNDDLKMHSLQETLIKSMVSSLGEFSVVMLALSGGLSSLPLSSAGSIDNLRESIHSLDHTLGLKPVHSSAHSTQECGTASTSILTGITTDCVSSILTAATKLLLQASVLGLDSTFAIAKIMEILSIHPRPLQALALESQGSSQPNGLSNNSNWQIQNSSVLSTLVAVSILAASNTELKSTNLQFAIDKRIEQVAFLEDEEEESALGLKAFFELLVRVLDGDKANNNDNYKDLISRFDRGGIALSAYHSAHGGIDDSERKKDNNLLINEHGFLKCDDAKALLETFINKAHLHENNSPNSELSKLKAKLIGQTMSAKSEKCWKHIVNKVMDRLKSESSNSSMLNSGHFRVQQKKLAERQEDLLHNWKPEQKEDDERSDQNKTEINF